MELYPWSVPPYKDFWYHCFSQYQTGKNADADLKSEIYEYSNKNEYREQGMFGYSIPLEFLDLREGIVGIFASDQNECLRVSIVAKIDRKIKIGSAPDFSFGIRKADINDPRTGDRRLAKRVFRPYHANGLVLAHSLPEIKPLIVSDLKPMDILSPENPRTYARLPRCFFAETGKPVIDLSLDDPIPCVELPCYIFAESAFIGFDRSGGAALNKGFYTWGASQRVKYLMAYISHVQRVPNSEFGNPDLDGRLVANFMGLVER